MVYGQMQACDPIAQSSYCCLGATLSTPFGLYNGCGNSVERQLLVHNVVVPCIFASYIKLYIGLASLIVHQGNDIMNCAIGCQRAYIPVSFPFYTIPLFMQDFIYLLASSFFIH
jgi:hypothetical protein